jgi:anthranilate phosphoribosyltransferase
MTVQSVTRQLQTDDITVMSHVTSLTAVGNKISQLTAQLVAMGMKGKTEEEVAEIQTRLLKMSEEMNHHSAGMSNI